MKNTTRRGLMGGAATLIATPVMASNAAVSIAGLSSPDAELIAVCASFNAVEAKVRAIFDGPNAIADDHQAELAAAIERDQIAVLLDRMDVLRASTPAGIQARAHTLALHNGDRAFSFDSDDTCAGRLLGYLMRDSAALGGSPSSTVAESDAALVRLCAEHSANRDAFNASDSDEDAENHHLWASYHATRDAITASHPTTLSGFRAKAWAAEMEATMPDGRMLYEGTLAMSWIISLVQDLAGSAAV